MAGAHSYRIPFAHGAACERWGERSMSLTYLITWLGPLLEVGILVGLVHRRRLSDVVMLPVLLVSLIASATVVGICPSCNTWSFWVVKECIHTGLLLALGLELAQRAFPSAPGRRAARRWASFVTVTMLVLVATIWRELAMVELLPRLVASVAWLYTGLSIVMLRHSRRVESLHDTILTSFAAYLMVYAALWSQVTHSAEVVALINPPVQLAVLAAVFYAAWAATPRVRSAARASRPAPPGDADVPRGAALTLPSDTLAAARAGA